MSHRAGNSALSKENEAFIKQGYYTCPDGTTVDLSSQVAEARRRAMSYDAAATESILSNITAAGFPPGSTRLEVTAESSSQAAERLHADGAQAITVLNFASARNPGGGYLTGAKAQEEDLCRVSALYTTLREAHDFYASHKHSDGRYSHRLVYSPDVPVFRTSSSEAAPNALLKVPFAVSFVTSPAPNVGALKKNHPKHLGEVPAILRERAARILAMCAHHNAKTLVLGAWGCGVFQNHPHDVARVFYNLLKPGGAFHGCFDQVVFAIFDRSRGQEVLKAFCAEFSVDMPTEAKVTGASTTTTRAACSTSTLTGIRCNGVSCTDTSDPSSPKAATSPRTSVTRASKAAPPTSEAHDQPTITAFFSRRRTEENVSSLSDGYTP